MSKQYIKMCTIKMWENDGDSKRGKYSNSKWTPYRDGSPADVNFRAGGTYSIAAFDNNDGTISIAISEVRDYQSRDNIADNISQGGLKPVGDAINQRHQPATKDTLDDDIPF
jgi:membrane protease subunit (stomatin/prohibitin family)